MTVKLPYTMYCPKCKVGIKVKSAGMIGKRIDCPKCKKKIEIVTPDEDANIPYIIEPAPVPEPEPEPTEEEIEAKELEELKKKRKEQLATAKYIGSIIWLILVLVGIGFGVWYFVIKDYGKKKKENEQAEPALIAPAGTSSFV